MATIRQIITTWNTPAGGDRKSVMFFEGGIAVASQRAALNTLWQAVDNAMASSTGWLVETAGVELDDQNGDLVGAWSHSTAYGGAGGGAGEPVPDSAQALIRWKTSTILDGRFLQGRTFLPGLTVGTSDDGNLQGATAVSLQTAANAFIASAAGLVIWHRPLKDDDGNVTRTGGHTAVSTADIWGEFAVLRRRR
jgi:hypothetical protein